MVDYTGKHVLVTGGSRGIGAATARAFGRLGARVAVHFRADAAAAGQVVAAISHARAFQADLSDWDAAEQLVAEVEAVAPVDVVVLNHGVWRRASIDVMTAGDYDATMSANLRGFASVAGAAARRMKPRRRGSIVMVASTAGQRGEAHHAHYAASKGAIISLTKSLASELAPFAIRVNCVAPGWVRTDMTEAALDDSVLAAIPLGRVGQPDDIAGPIAFIASDAAAFVTGEIFNVNGGAVLCG
jgi:3-oxoacyl-[acyl-carrier protein] reductase